MRQEELPLPVHQQRVRLGPQPRPGRQPQLVAHLGQDRVPVQPGQRHLVRRDLPGVPHAQVHQRLLAPPKPGLPRAEAIIRLACGALTGKLTGPAPATVSRTSLAGTDSCALNVVRRLRAVDHPGQPLPWRDRHPGPPLPRAVSQSGYRGKDGIHPNGQGAFAACELTSPACQPRRAAGCGTSCYGHSRPTPPPRESSTPAAALSRAQGRTLGP